MVKLYRIGILYYNNFFKKGENPKMKKKILLALLIVSMLVCLFAVSVSAEEMNPEYNSQYVLTMTDGMTSVVLEDGTTSKPLYDEQGYTLCYYWDDVSSDTRQLLSVRTKDLTFNFNGTKLSSIYYGDEHLAGTANKGKIVVLNLRGVKNGSGQDITNFNSDNLFKEDSPLQHIFMPNSIVDIIGYAFGFRNANLSHLIGCYFSENSQLKTVSDNMFLNCKNLRYFNMPLGVTKIGSSAFSNCVSLGEMYIPSGVTQLGYSDSSNASPFNGCTNMYFVNTPGEAKPDVYYIPSSVKTVMSELFKGCKNLNNVIVFNENITSVSNGWTFSGSNAIKIVFLGDMVNVSTTGNAWNSGITLYFCNEADKSASDLTGLGGAPKKVYCHGEGNTTHLPNPNNTITEDATCTTNEKTTETCFCGTAMGTSEVENSALGHNHDLAEGAILVGIVYADFAKEGNKVVKCSRCEETDSTQAVVAIFGTAQFSIKDDGTAICVSYTINNSAYNAFLEANEGASLEFGIVAAASLDAGVESPLDVENKIAHDFTGSGYTAFDLRLSGDWETQSEVFLSMALYTSYKADAEAEATVNYVTEAGSAEACQVVTYAEIAARYENG